VPEEVPRSYATAVGERLRNLRKQRGLSLLAVEEISGREFKASVLGAYERGERVISVLRLQRLAQLYRVPVDQLLPRTALAGAAAGVAGLAPPPSTEPSQPVRIDLSRLNDPAQSPSPEKEVIRRYVNMLQMQRSESSGRVLAIRGEDVRALGRIFERDEAAMTARLAELGLTT
jgi:transcriptional regulator with XRE-family HTH domain